MLSNIQLPTLEHKYIKLYDSQDEQQADEINYEECCYYIVKSPLAGEDNDTTYQYSVRTTNNDNKRLGHYYSVETPYVWSGLEIVWGYFGWEFIDYQWKGEDLYGGNLFLKINTNVVKSIPDGNRLQHINNFLGSQDNINTIEEFDNSNIISATTLNGYRSVDSVRQLTCNIKDWPNVENAYGMFQNIQLTIKDNELNLPKAVDVSYIFASDTETTITFNWDFPLAENCSYAFYNVLNDINSFTNNVFNLTKVTNIDYCFAADFLKQINVNITSLPTVTTAKGLFAYRKINNNNNNIDIVACEFLDYALQGCDLSQINNINFTTSDVLKSLKGFLCDVIINNIEDSYFNSLKYITNFNNVDCFDEYLKDVNHDNTNKKVEFDISSQTGSHESVTLKNFATNANIILKFIGNNKCNYDNFATNAILEIEENSDFNDGTSYNNFCNGVTFNTSIIPISDFKDNIHYNNVYEGCVFNQPINIDFGTTVKTIKDYFKDSVFHKDSEFVGLEYLAEGSLNFGFSEVKDIFDYTLFNDTLNYGFETTNAKIFNIDTQFNCKTIKSQTINILIDCRKQKEEEHYFNYYLINNNIVEDLSGLTIDVKGYIDKKIDPHVVITSQTLIKTPHIKGVEIYAFEINNVPNLQELNLEDFHGGYSTNINIDQNELIYVRLGAFFYGILTITSSKLNIATLTDSFNKLTVSRTITLQSVIWNQLPEETRTHVISIAYEINLLYDYETQ